MPNGISYLLHLSVEQRHPRRSLETLVLHYLTNQYRRFCGKICAVFVSAKKKRKKRKGILNGAATLYAELRRDTFQTVRDGEP